MHLKIRLGAVDIGKAREEIEEFRVRTGQDTDELTSLRRLLRQSAIRAEAPIAVLAYKSGMLYGVALLSVRRRWGLPVGFVTGGNLAGQGTVIALPEDRLAVLELATCFLLRRSLAFAVKLSTLVPGHIVPPDSLPVRGVQGHWHFREARIRIDLRDGMPAVMERLSYKMRRNVRYYRRRAEAELGWVFVPGMTRMQRYSAVAALHDKGAYPTAALRAAQIDAALQDTPGHFAMGLQDADGGWVSYVTGWRAEDGTYVEWQLNYDQQEGTSVSTVMRAFLLQHEAEHGSPSLVFVGLTAPFWARACELEVCADLVATTNGPLGMLVRKLLPRLSPQGLTARLLARSAALRPGNKANAAHPMGRSGETLGS